MAQWLVFFAGTLTAASLRGFVATETPMRSADTTFLSLVTGVRGSLNDAPRDPHVPRYMMALYHRIEELAGGQRNRRCAFPDEDLPGNIVRSITKKGIVPRADGTTGGATLDVTFNLSHIPQLETVNLVYLMFSKQPEAVGKWRAMSLTVYQLSPEGRVSNQAGAKNYEPQRHYLSTVQLSRFDEWQLINVTRPYLELQTAEIYSLHLAVVPNFESNIVEYDDGFLGNTNKRMDVSLIVVSRDETQCHNRQRRAAFQRNSLRANLCRRVPFYVDFRVIGWTNWIIAPAGFQAYRCHGECPFPIHLHMNGTNHAVIQSLVNSMRPGAAPKVCCAPSRLGAMSMLYFDYHDNVILRHYDDMVVEACGCQ